MVFLQFATVGTGTHVIAFCPCPRNQLDEVVVAFLIFSQYYQVPAALVLFTFALIHRAVRHIHFTPDNGFEQFAFRLGNPGTAVSKRGFFVIAFLSPAFNGRNPFFQVFYFTFGATVLLVDIVIKLLDTKHVSMVGNGYSFHAIPHCFVHQLAYARLPIEQRVLGVHM